MRVFVSAVLAAFLAIPADADDIPGNADNYAPMRKLDGVLKNKVVGMIFAEAIDDDIVYVRVSVSKMKRKLAHTAWIACHDSNGRNKPVHLDGTIGDTRLEGYIDLEEFCPDGHMFELIVVNHEQPVPYNVTYKGLTGSVWQVTTNDGSDPFCNGEAEPTTGIKNECGAIAKGFISIPDHEPEDDDEDDDD